MHNNCGRPKRLCLDKGWVSRNWQTPPICLPVLYIANQKADSVCGHGMLLIGHRTKWVFNKKKIEFSFNTGSESGLGGVINTV